MKINHIIIFIFIVINMSAQSPVLPLTDNYVTSISGAYYKDLDNELGKFVGTWKYTNGTTSFTIILQKKSMFYNLIDNYYQDIIVGEYKYINNGVEVVNTLSNLNVTYNDEYKYNICGVIIKDKTITSVGNRPIQLTFNDPDREYINSEIFIKHIASQGGNPATIEVEFKGSMSVLLTDTSPTSLRVSELNYILTKQP